MEFFNKVEKMVLGWYKAIPNLPVTAQKWLGENIWWIVLIAAILTGIGVISSLVGLFALISLLGSVAASWYATTAITSWGVVVGIVSIAFSVIQGVLLALAVAPLKEKKKSGWMLLFAVWILSAVAVVVNSILNLNVIGFIFGIIFGAVWIAISGYFLFQIHGQFTHFERTRGAKNAK